MSEWTTVIKPKKSLLDIDLKGVWLYRDLIRMYVRRDIVTVYKQTILGPLWFLIQPMLTTVMYMFVFGGLAGISTDGLPQALFYMAGITLWNYFSTVFNKCSNVFAANSSVFGKVYFPRLVVPISGAISNLLQFLMQFCLFLAFFCYYAFFTDPHERHCPAAPCPDCHGRRARHVLGPHNHLAHDQIQRPDASCHLRPPALHVCDPCHLPFEFGA